MASRRRVIFESLITPVNVPTIIGTSGYLVKQGTNPTDVVVTAAATDICLGMLRKKTSVADEAGELVPLIPGQTLPLVSDGTAIAKGDRIVPSALVAGRVKKQSTGPQVLNEHVVGIAAEAGGAAGTELLTDIIGGQLAAAS